MDSGHDEVHPSSRRRVHVDSRNESPYYDSQESTTNSTATATAAPMHQTKLAKELMRLIPRYDGTGEVQKLIEYIEGFEEYLFSQDSLTAQEELSLATAKGDAKI